MRYTLQTISNPSSVSSVYTFENGIEITILREKNTVRRLMRLCPEDRPYETDHSVVERILSRHEAVDA